MWQHTGVWECKSPFSYFLRLGLWPQNKVCASEHTHTHPFLVSRWVYRGVQGSRLSWLCFGLPIRKKRWPVRNLAAPSKEWSNLLLLQNNRVAGEDSWLLQSHWILWSAPWAVQLHVTPFSKQQSCRPAYTSLPTPSRESGFWLMSVLSWNDDGRALTSLVPFHWIHTISFLMSSCVDIILR